VEWVSAQLVDVPIPPVSPVSSDPPDPPNPPNPLDPLDPLDSPDPTDPPDQTPSLLIPFPDGITDYPDAGDEPTVEAVRSVYVETRETAQKLSHEVTDYKKFGIAMHKSMQNRKLDSLRHELCKYADAMDMHKPPRPLREELHARNWAPETLRAKLTTHNCGDFLDTSAKWRNGPDVQDKSVIEELDRREYQGRHGNAGELKLATQAVLETYITVTTHLQELRALDGAYRACDKYEAEAREDIATGNAFQDEAMKLMAKYNAYYERGVAKRQKALGIKDKLAQLGAAHAPTREFLDKDAKKRVWHMIYNGNTKPNKRDVNLCKTLGLEPYASSPRDVTMTNLFSGLVDTVARNKFGKLLEAAATATSDTKGFVDELSTSAKAQLLEQLQASLAYEGEETHQQLRERRPDAPRHHESSGSPSEGGEVEEGEIVQEVIELDEEDESGSGSEEPAYVLPKLAPIAEHLL
tara:strand:+ start:8612 stop:10009 length:1398 start_codon:yes stop_codon:yes gene_type:complete